MNIRGWVGVGSTLEPYRWYPRTKTRKVLLSLGEARANILRTELFDGSEWPVQPEQTQTVLRTSVFSVAVQ